MLVVTRYRVPEADAAGFLNAAEQVLAVLSQQRGWLSGRIGRATDDPTLWVLATEWADVGSYRRALGAYDVKVTAVPLLATAIDEPTAFEVLAAAGAGERSGPAGRTHRAADAGQVGIGDAAAPVVPTDFD